MDKKVLVIVTRCYHRLVSYHFQLFDQYENDMYVYGRECECVVYMCGVDRNYQRC